MGIAAASWEPRGVDEWAMFWISYGGLAVVFTVLELIRPARKLRYRKAVPLDLVAFVVYQFAVVRIAGWVTDPMFAYLPVSEALAAAWLPVRVLAFFLAADFGSYWMHRWLHTRHLWRAHRWHHSSTQMYWLSGVRATAVQQILFNVPYLLAAPLLVAAPPWVFLGVIAEGVARNNWMHMNVSWRSRWIEYVFVTPRFHHIHHSADAQLHDGNYGSLFTLWDRLFGTYLDPESTRPRTFGTGEPKRDPVLLMIGL
jgi:sterol desaturase/sphingolipid hydroxylase (fatty acid hydroxylase superfamily)